jgi:hypothetical protein
MAKDLTFTHPGTPVRWARLAGSAPLLGSFWLLIQGQGGTHSSVGLNCFKTFRKQQTRGRMAHSSAPDLLLDGKVLSLITHQKAGTLYH